MLAEKEALLVLGTEEFSGSELIAGDLSHADDSRRSAQPFPPGPFEAALIARLKAGEMAAFDELVAEYQPLVYALAWRILNDVEDARDATQEAFLKIYRHFPKFRGEASLKTWICRIAINQARSTERWWRRRRRNETTSIDAQSILGDEDDFRPGDKLASACATPESETLSREKYRHLEFALLQLKKDFRIAVVLRDIEGLSYEEIAYVTEISVGTVKSRIARGRETLRELLRQQDAM